MQPLLSVSGLTVRFGGIRALTDVSFEVREGEITGLIGPNGAGKTTCLNCIARLCKPASGTIFLDADDLLRGPGHEITRRRVARTFQNLALFEGMTVLENVLVGTHARRRTTPGRRASDARIAHEVRDILERLGIAPVGSLPVRGLPLGTRKMVELARALAAAPRLLLLDEPAGGLNFEEVATLGATLKNLRTEFAMTILLVEHHMQLVMGSSDHIVVLNSGRKLAEGPPGMMQHDPAVIEAYLGAP